ncbi:MAG: hypothetical protein K8T91_03735, partial [Planctomycetes bacterium]|nr:hypothetical protein [Planctomycetota bacterium]
MVSHHSGSHLIGWQGPQSVACYRPATQAGLFWGCAMNSSYCAGSAQTQMPALPAARIVRPSGEKATLWMSPR